ncbi:hypothetical protein G9P44_005769 [Scheffersomyces stipitis]|nr:hypothetical protein G9P44_005769 [Scheffersomyces stipitis]
MFIVSSATRKIDQLYRLYYYNSPIPVMTNGETVIFNSINFCLLLVGLYYVVHVLPSIVVHSFEKMYYYLTGNLVSVNVVVSSLLLLNTKDKLYSTCVDVCRYVSSNYSSNSDSVKVNVTQGARNGVMNGKYIDKSLYKFSKF